MVFVFGMRVASCFKFFLLLLKILGSFHTSLFEVSGTNYKKRIAPGTGNHVLKHFVY